MATPLDSLERLGDAFAADAAIERKRMLVIVNPYATTVSDRLKNLVVYALQGRYEVEAIDTQKRNHATELCREAAQEGYDVVVAFGGDGTVNEAANGLAGSATPLTTLPGGSTNVYCRMLGIPAEIVDATEHLLRVADTWAPRTVDLGRVNDRWFTFCSGVGLDASVVERVDSHPRRKAKYGPFYYTYAATTTFLKDYVVNPPRLEVVLPDGTAIPGVTTLVQNADPYTYFNSWPIHAAEAVALDSGTLSAVALSSSSPTVMPGVTWRMFSKNSRIEKHRRVTGAHDLTAFRVRTTDDRPLPVQVDGDFIGCSEEAVYTVTPGALTVIA